MVLSSQSEVSPQIFVFINTAMALAPPVLLPLTPHLGSSGHLDSFALCHHGCIVLLESL